MRLIAYPLSGTVPLIRPASVRRDWMDDSPQRFAYRCLPMTIANSHGWEILSPVTFEATWDGGSGQGSVKIERLDDSTGRLPISHFGCGILTFEIGCLIRTEDGYNLYVTGPANTGKDGITALTGIVEASWMPYTFTMNWRFTRPGVPVRFQQGEPFCLFFPIPSGLVETVMPEWRSLASDRELSAQIREWGLSRAAWNRDLLVDGSLARAEGWQRFYSRGTLASGRVVAGEHRTRLAVRPFVSGVPAESSGQAPPKSCGERAPRDHKP